VLVVARPSASVGQALVDEGFRAISASTNDGQQFRLCAIWLLSQLQANSPMICNWFLPPYAIRCSSQPSSVVHCRAITTIMEVLIATVHLHFARFISTEVARFASELPFACTVRRLLLLDTCEHLSKRCRLTTSVCYSWMFSLMLLLIVCSKC
jgi:hypothetical protein